MNATYKSPVAPLLLATAGAIALTANAVNAAPVALAGGAATFTQTCDSFDHSVSSAIDGNPLGNDGWAIADNCLPGNSTASQTAVWETVTDVNATNFIFYLDQNYSGHLIGNFRLSITSDDRSLFDDGLDTGGDVTANWTVLTDAVVTGPSGMTFTTQPNDSILAAGTLPSTATYSVSFEGVFAGITGIRLEVLELAGLPFDGPGLQPINGNLVLSEISLIACADVNDCDLDAIANNADNCVFEANANQRDTDDDGIGNRCDPDLDNSCSVNFGDLNMLKAVFFSNDADADFDGSGQVNFADLVVMKEFFFGSPGPSGIPNLCE